MTFQLNGLICNKNKGIICDNMNKNKSYLSKHINAQTYRFYISIVILHLHLILSSVIVVHKGMIIPNYISHEPLQI